MGLASGRSGSPDMPAGAGVRRARAGRVDKTEARFNVFHALKGEDFFSKR